MTTGQLSDQQRADAVEDALAGYKSCACCRLHEALWRAYGNRACRTCLIDWHKWIRRHPHDAQGWDDFVENWRVEHAVEG